MGGDNINNTHINFINYLNINIYCRDTSQLDTTITLDEVRDAISCLKSNKSHGPDLVINEFFKVAPDKLKNVIVKFFNIVLNTGIVPSSWTLGVIHPIYKNKGQRGDPNNYRGITILSCFGKLFTCILNKRLGIFIEKYDIIGAEQTGFRKGFSTLDHLFTLYGIIDVLLSKRKRLYCAFLDYEKAFDKINRAFLWQKLLNENVDGKIINVVKNMYSQAKSCVAVDGSLSDIFKVDIGVRQGENLSPVLFSFFLNDMNTFLATDMHGLTTIINEMKRCEINPNIVNVFYKLFVLLYADDTIIFAESAEELQRGLSKTKNYCDKWKLKLNARKCKVVIFSRGMVRNYPNFYIGDETLEVVKNFTYLGLKLNYNNRFNVTQTDLFDRASRAMFTLMKKGQKLSLPIDLMLDMFDHTVAPVLLYGCEIWGFQTLYLIEKLQLKFYKFLLKLRPSTPSHMVYGETGKVPITTTIKCRLLLYWHKLICKDNYNKLSSIIYDLLYKLYNKGTHINSYIAFVKNTLIEIGLPGVWDNQKTIKLDRTWFKNYIKTTLQNQFIKGWQDILDNNSMYIIYRMIKPNFIQSPYISTLINTCAIPIVRFITTNNNLPVNVLRYVDVERMDRICTKCNLGDTGDEFHYIFICPFFTLKRNEVLPNWYRTRPNAIKFQSLFNTNSKNILLKLKHFICHINKTLA